MNVQDCGISVFDMIISEFVVEFFGETPSENGAWLAYREGFIYMKGCAWSSPFLN
jgi:hypothetical protein